MTHKDRAHLAAVSSQGIAVFLTGLGFSSRNPGVGEAILMSGGVIVLVNAWFAWTVRKIDNTMRILGLHLVRFVLLGLGVAIVIVWRNLHVLTCVVTMVGAHLVYVTANFRFGLSEGSLEGRHSARYRHLDD